MIRAVPNLESLIGHRDLSRDAICWTLSSAKPGNGVDQIRDSSVETYWQSDGTQPHTLQVVFSRRVAISHVCLYLDFNIDESYTPKKVCVDVGMTVQELETILVVELSEPVGWCILPLEAPPDPLDDEETGLPFVRTHLLQISILTMHQNGRDTHVRRVKLLGPKPAMSIQGQRILPEFSTVALSQFSTIR
jgi:anaphase-promoting complex subunit 10